MSNELRDILELDDVQVLLEAMEAWENKDDAGALMSGMVGALLTKGDEEWKAKQKESDDKLAAAKRMRKERSVLLRAKLIQFKDTLIAQGVQ